MKRWWKSETCSALTEVIHSLKLTFSHLKSGSFVFRNLRDFQGKPLFSGAFDVSFREGTPKKMVALGNVSPLLASKMEVILDVTNPTSPQKVAFWKGNPRLFQGNLAW